MRLFKRKTKPVYPNRPVAKLRARYDAAQTTRDNVRHWAMADSLSAKEANSYDVRKKLRERSRYEVDNNSYAKGITLTIANDCVGTGPRLQLLTEDADFNKKVECDFYCWSKRIKLASKLRTMRMSKSTDGEVFGLLTSNPVTNNPVNLDLILVETDRVTMPWQGCRGALYDNNVDGVIFDNFGNPIQYCILDEHTGGYGTAQDNYRLVGAESMIHWFRADRPGQVRGVPEITTALPLFAQLRRYTLAVIAAAETAADFAAVLFSDSPSIGEEPNWDPMDVVELEKRMATVLPEGWKLGQIKAEQPATSYSEFKREILNEIARCLNIPYNIAACNSSGYNYASGRLDHQTYYKSIRVEQEDLGEVVLNKIFEAWFREYLLQSSTSLLFKNNLHVPRQWFFDGTEHVDPAKEANAQKTRLASSTTTLAAEYAKQGKDWETELKQIAKEKQMMSQLKLIDNKK